MNAQFVNLKSPLGSADSACMRLLDSSWFAVGVGVSVGSGVSVGGYGVLVAAVV
jgi:hypothetical protein